MIKLIFSEPIRYKDFVNQGLGHCRGIYILGFKNTFSPYYVGKHQSCINTRVQSHYKGIHHTSNYTIFTKEFYENLPNIDIKRIAQPYRKFQNYWLARHKNKILKGTHESIEGIINDVFSEEHLFVSFAEAKDTTNEELRWCETAVKFCLKVNTIGRSGLLISIKNSQKEIIISSGKELSTHFHPKENPKIDLYKNFYYGYE